MEIGVPVDISSEAPDDEEAELVEQPRGRSPDFVTPNVAADEAEKEHEADEERAHSHTPNDQELMFSM